MSVLRTLALCGVLALVASTAAAQSLCTLSGYPNNQTVDLSPIMPAKYSAVLNGVGGSQNVSVSLSWCQPVLNSKTCGVSNYTMAITMAGQCITEFSVLLGPISNGTIPNSVQYTIWGPENGDQAFVTVVCNPKGKVGTAALVGSVINTPGYTYDFTFSSVHACPSA